MADDLVGMQEGLGLLPDNTTREIDAIDHRRVALSFLRDRGGMFADPALGPWTVTIVTTDVWVDLGLGVGAAMTVTPNALFWSMDANGAAIYDYASDWPTVGIPPGYSRSVLVQAVIDIDPDGDHWEFAIAVAGVPILPFYSVDTANQTKALTVSVTARSAIDVSVAPTVSVMARNRDNAGNLALNTYGVALYGGPQV